MLIAWLLPALKMAGRNGHERCAASSKMENNADLVLLEGRIDAALSESRERLLRMQVLRGVLDRERMLMRIRAQEKELESLKSAQRLLQVSRFRSHGAGHSFNHNCTSSLPLRLRAVRVCLCVFVNSVADEKGKGASG